MRRFPLFLMCMCVISVALAGCSGRTMANWKVQSAIEQCDRGDRMGCKLTLTEALDNDPLNPYAVEAMGEVLEAEGKYDAAEAYYQEAYQRGGERVALKPDAQGEPVRLKDEAAERLRRLRAKVAVLHDQEEKGRAASTR